MAMAEAQQEAERALRESERASVSPARSEAPPSPEPLPSPEPKPGNKLLLFCKDSKISLLKKFGGFVVKIEDDKLTYVPFYYKITYSLFPTC